MDAEQLYEVIAKGKVAIKDNAEALESLAERYPWCHTLRLLQLASLYVTASPQYNTAKQSLLFSFRDKALASAYLRDTDGYLRTWKLFKESIEGMVEENIIEQPIEICTPSVPETQEEESIITDQSPTEPSPWDLIDKFIADEPKLTARITDYEPDLAASEKEDFSTATETIADIYFSQQMFDKALAIYQSLLERNPEKSIYYQAQIRRIEEEIKKSNELEKE